MLHYIALIWNETDAGAVETLLGVRNQLVSRENPWIQVLMCRGLAVYCSGIRAGRSQVCLLSDGAGVIVGSIFHRPNSRSTRCRPDHFEKSRTERVSATRGKVLAHEYWGSNVAFLTDRHLDETSVLRSPFGTLPCFWTTHRRIRVYFSDFRDCLFFGLAPTPLALNWHHVVHVLVHPGVAPSGQTGIKGVNELLAGECHRYCGEREKNEFLWNPISIADTYDLEQAHIAFEELRRNALDVGSALVSDCASIVHTLSGGFDSSLAVALMHSADPKPEITLLNYYSLGCLRSDERAHASTVSDFFGYRLISHVREEAVDLEAMLGVFPDPTPQNDFYCLISARAEARYAIETGASVITSGFGGDQLFCQSRAQASSDYAVRHRIPLRIFQIAFGEARLERTSVWRKVRNAISNSYSDTKWNPHADIGSFYMLIRPEALDALKRAASDDVHPMLAHVPGDRRRIWGCRGKMDQIQFLLSPPRHRNPYGSIDHPDLLSILYAEPIARTCIRIPNYVHTAGGWDRGAARRTFRNDLPQPTVHRRSKGGFEDIAHATINRNSALIRDLVLNCKFLAETIDLRRFNDRVASRPGTGSVSNIEVLDYAFTAAWVANIEALSRVKGPTPHAPPVVSGRAA